MRSRPPRRLFYVRPGFDDAASSGSAQKRHFPAFEPGEALSIKAFMVSARHAATAAAKTHF
jgi:hypothetical protein